ncbi:aspartate carbamoyltransferase regulatory subunit [Candidatus Woesearchaeota archaeon]|nr:aspartate carbamoyltransferase regulatory subunit [Candidatus Woesearchaeota archaeon]
MIDKKIRIDPIKNGTSIDHLNPGTALEVMKVLGLHDTGIVTIGMHLESKKFGYKDIIKIENKELTQDEINKITLISPHASISIIKNFNVEKKFEVMLPKVIEGSVKCKNPKCITNIESVETKFHIITKSPLKIQCHHCERHMKKEDISLL